MDELTPFYTRLAAAFVRGHFCRKAPQDADPRLFYTALDELSADSLCKLIEIGLRSELRLHKFKRTMGLPRVRRVLGALRSFRPSSVLDIGSGRGAFLWPLLDTFPDLAVTAIDRLDYRVDNLIAVAGGGLKNLTALEADATALPFPDNSFDIVTMLEVLEHIPSPEKAAAEISRVAGRAIILSVPSQPDDNPEHIHLFDECRIRELFGQAGLMKLRFERVLNHIIVVATKDASC